MLDTHEILGATVTCSPLLEKGTTVGGRYEIECCLGVGGMATVFRARHVGLNQCVAIKVISPAILDAPGAVERFMREARAATRLKGTHIVRVFDVGTTDEGAPYMVMELLEGQDLGAIIDDGFRPTVEEAVDYILQACEALAEVHGVGMVHRDLKPPNMFVTTGPDGLSCLKLIDFGISRVDSPLSPYESLGVGDQSLVLGSPGYMAPEQMESAAQTDARSDIWSLGAIAYELFLGKVPYAGDSLSDIYTAVLHGPPQVPSTIRPEIPQEVDEIILKCLRVAPEERYANVAQLALALVPFGNEYAAARAAAVRRVFAASQPPPPLVAKLELAKPAGPFIKAGERSPCVVSVSPDVQPRRRRYRRLATALVAVAGLAGVGLVAFPNSPVPVQSALRRISWSPATAHVTVATGTPTFTAATPSPRMDAPPAPPPRIEARTASAPPPAREVASAPTPTPIMTAARTRHAPPARRVPEPVPSDGENAPVVNRTPPADVGPASVDRSSVFEERR